MQQPITVEKGQRYIQVLHKGTQMVTWEVESILLDGTHAPLFKVSDRYDFKTLSCSMLDGKHDFSLTNQ